MNDYFNQVKAAIQATLFHSSTTYSWFGKRSLQLPATIKRALTPETARNYLLYSLQSQLYSDFYCRGFAAPTKQEAIVIPRRGMTPFVEALSAANCGGGYWEDNWEVCMIGEGEMVVYKGGLELWVRPEDCLVPDGTTVVRGTRLSLHFPKEFLGISPGFYMILSDKQLARDDSQPLIRLYWNLRAEGAVPFVRSVTSLLNRAHLPFKLKVLRDPVLFTRCDAAVIYMLKRDYDVAAETLSRVYSEVVTNLRQGIPVFTKLLAPGIGLAEDPGEEESFGLHRCRLLGDGMIRAFEHGKKSVEERLQIVIDRFTEDDISLEKPFLNPGSSDNYNFQVYYDSALYRC
jgi:HopA1 effector protein family